ncbi:MAG: uncharacterized protein FD189_1220 [Elusimicrobia bacterium]|nr:MAG: uncharacterized protein FD189_1220 [Elusimicrobiota bacterium]
MRHGVPVQSAERGRAVTDLSFRDPVFLLLALPALAAALYAWRGGRARGAAISLPAALPPKPTPRARAVLLLPVLLRFAAMLLLIVALARPQKITRGQLPPAQGIDILLTIDTSLSMAATDFNPNRLGAAKAAALEFVSRRKNDRIGVVVFGGTAMLACPLTLDYEAVTEFVEAIDFNMTRVDGTAIGDAIVTSVNHIKDSKAKSKVVILLTDGRSNSGMITDPAAGARAAAVYDIKVYTIGTAGRGPAQIPTGDPTMPVVTIDEDLDEPTLLEIARLTGGEFFRARNQLELQRVYSQIDAMEKTEFQARSLSSYHDAHMPLLAAGALLLALCFVLEKTWLRRLP